jgi:mannose/fructose/N-acetylgalactosamine-specific phosphotransferase system component IIC|tara:strand:+ start:245 stop:463 length:219 start_codon:yes stop_codon:yes gene_type:complete
MKNGKILPSQFTTDDGHISLISVAFFGLTLAVIYYQLSFYQKWLKSIDQTSKLETRIQELEKGNQNNNIIIS